MGLFGRKKKAEKEAQKALEIERRAQQLQKEREQTVQAQKQAAIQKKDDDRQQVLQDMRQISAKVELWNKKVAKLESDRDEVRTKLLAYSQKKLPLPETLARKHERIKKDLKLAQGQLTTLENTKSNLEAAQNNAYLVEGVEQGSAAIERIAPSTERVEEVLGKAQDQEADIEEANSIFLADAQKVAYDEDDLLEELNQFSVEQGLAEPQQVQQKPQTAEAIPSPPDTAPTPARQPQPAPATITVDPAEEEMRRLEKSLAA